MFSGVGWIRYLLMRVCLAVVTARSVNDRANWHVDLLFLFLFLLLHQFRIGSFLRWSSHLAPSFPCFAKPALSRQAILFLLHYNISHWWEENTFRIESFGGQRQRAQFVQEDNYGLQNTGRDFFPVQPKLPPEVTLAVVEVEGTRLEGFCKKLETLWMSPFSILLLVITVRWSRN